MTGGVKENFYHAPSVYNGRASSVVPSPAAVRRPKGVMWDTGKGSGKPIYGPSRKLDFELEMGYFVSKPVPFGETMRIEDAREHAFGFVLLNDWSARDLQAFEMPPLGPFHSKGTSTSSSDYGKWYWSCIVRLMCVEASGHRFRRGLLRSMHCCPLPRRQSTITHLRFLNIWIGRTNRRLLLTSNFARRLYVSYPQFQIMLSSYQIAKCYHDVGNNKHHQITTSNLSSLYWTPYQQLTHHASAGCGLATGDLLGSGTISGDNDGELGCLFEATQDGTRDLDLGDGERLAYLEDEDEIVLEGWCGAGEGRIGFGECRGVLLAAMEN